MIERIHIRNCATFNSSGIILDELKKVNFIYGSNGSGKTTISNFLKDIASNTDSSIVWKRNSPLKVLVYNKKFREENFKMDAAIPGVFTLGKATIEQLDSIEQLNKELDDITKFGTNKRDAMYRMIDEKTTIQNNFAEYCWENIKKSLAGNFKEAFVGVLHKKEAFRDKLLDKSKELSSPIKPQAIEELKARAQILFSNDLNLLPSIRFDERNLKRVGEICSNPIWETVVIGKSDVDIADLINTLKMGDWVNKGREYLRSDSDRCPFCQQPTITAAFRDNLEKYYDDTFQKNSQLIKNLNNEYNQNLIHLSQQLRALLEQEKNNQQSKLDTNLFETHITSLLDKLSLNKALINQKDNELSRKVELAPLDESIECILRDIKTTNENILSHNHIVNNSKQEKEQLISDIWGFVIHSHQEELRKYNQSITGKEKGINALEKQVKEKRIAFNQKKAEIDTATKSVTNTESSVVAINEMLALYGFGNFKIQNTKENHYQILRDNGELAQHTLSEGEMTFITFLYYLQLAQGSLSDKDIAEDRVLVIDDPISSIDSTVLFVVSSLLKEQIKKTKRGKSNIKQITILTHNIYFHKEVTYVDRSDNDRDNVAFWVLRKNGNISSIQAYEKKNPIKGSYELLWAELLEKEKLSNISIQNTLRRIIEIYFKTMGGFSDEEILDSFGNPHEKEIARSLLCWINDGSHCLPDDLYVENQCDTVEKFLIVFKKIFESLGHINHYNMMIKIANKNNIGNLTNSN